MLNYNPGPVSGRSGRSAMSHHTITTQATEATETTETAKATKFRPSSHGSRSQLTVASHAPASSHASYTSSRGVSGTRAASVVAFRNGTCSHGVRIIASSRDAVMNQCTVKLALPFACRRLFDRYVH